MLSKSYLTRRCDWKGVFSFNKSPYEKILTEPNICKGLFTRMIGVLVLMWQRQTHATISGHFWSVYDLAWPKSSKDHSDMSCSILFHNILQDLLKGQHLASICEYKITQFWQSRLSPFLMSGRAALSRSKVRSKSLWPSSTCTIPCQYKKHISILVTVFLPVLARRPMFKRHMHEALESRIGQHFCLAV